MNKSATDDLDNFAEFTAHTIKFGENLDEGEMAKFKHELYQKISTRRQPTQIAGIKQLFVGLSLAGIALACVVVVFASGVILPKLLPANQGGGVGLISTNRENPPASPEALSNQNSPTDADQDSISAFGDQRLNAESALETDEVKRLDAIIGEIDSLKSDFSDDYFNEQFAGY